MLFRFKRLKNLLQRHNALELHSVARLGHETHFDPFLLNAFQLLLPEMKEIGEDHPDEPRESLLGEHELALELPLQPCQSLGFTTVGSIRELVKQLPDRRL